MLHSKESCSFDPMIKVTVDSYHEVSIKTNLEQEIILLIYVVVKLATKKLSISGLELINHGIWITKGGGRAI